MVEVDVFWSYGIGAGFAFASSRAAKRMPFKQATFESLHFRNTLLYLALIFAPSGVALVWGFPSWETMHLGTRDMPHWLVGLFAVTNVSQGILGFAVTRWLSARGRVFEAYLQWVAGYFLMFFILVHGWDGTGYQRFFSPTPEHLAHWTWATVPTWLTSGVAATLIVEGVFVIPPILYFMSTWLVEGRRGAAGPSRAFLAPAILAFLVLGVPATATLASVCVRQLGWGLGLLAFTALTWAVGLRKSGLLRRHCEQLYSGRPFFERRDDHEPVRAITPVATARVDSTVVQ